MLHIMLEINLKGDIMKVALGMVFGFLFGFFALAPILSKMGFW
jgi:hypothetical protein